MNKKFLSAILFGALMVTSTGTFVSCKDYDDEIKELQGQVSSLATKSDVEAKLTQLQAAIDAAKAESASNAAKIAALTKCECDVDAMMAEIKDAVDADMAGYKADIEALVAQVEALVGEIADFVTSVEFWASYQGGEWPTWNKNIMNFFTLTEKANVFEDGLTGALTFTADKQTQVAQNSMLVRVSPTNAVLTPEMISLVNSKGENLDEYVDIKVEKYTDLLTRGASNNGLWKITPVLKKYDKDQFAALKYADVKKGDVNGNRILYAVQVNNSLESAEARYVTSEYEMTFGSWEAFKGNNELLFTVDGVSIKDLNNRYSVANNPSLPKFDASKFDGKLFQEYVWSGDAATEPIYETKDKKVKNVTEGDDRHDKALALAVQGKAMTIAIDNLVKDDAYEGKVAGLYVTLDKEANAVESAPSEWNAWNKYDITGLNTVVEGTSTTITIDSEETINDIIGFRVYAVNLDGTLVDPDGRAFYVLVGEQAAETQTIAATITPTNDPKTHLSVTKALTDAQSEVITALLSAQKNNPLVEMAEDKADKYGVKYDVTFNKSDDGKKYVSATFTLAEGEIKDMINDKTYKASIVYKNANGHVLGEVNFELTKTMPDAFPTDFAFRPKQETTDGSGKFVAYMMPSINSYAVADAYSTVGYKDLNNVFYGLDDYYYFEFATSKKDKDKKYTLPYEVEDATANKKAEYILTVDEALIDNATPHAVSVWYTYPGISTYSYTDADGNEAWAYGVAHPVKYGETLEATYACWEDASAFTWGETKVNNVAVSTKPVLQWTAEGVQREANLADIVSTNSYNNDFFGQDLNELINVSNLLKIATKDADDKAITTIKLTVGEQVNPYYVPTIEGSKIIFKQAETQVDAAPTADHEETLTITLVDAFGHQVTMSLPVTVKAPEKK